MIFFTSDNHFFHRNIMKYCNRPFEHLNEMDGTMVVRWNERVRKGDTVYHLGDFTLGDKERAQEYFSDLNGRIRVLSNPWHHDKRWLSNRILGGTDFISACGHSVELLPPIFILEFPELSDGEYPQVIVLCHYPLARWDRCHYGSWHLFGHCHGRFENLGLSYDVGVDNNDFYPVSLDQVVEIMKRKERILAR